MAKYVEVKSLARQSNGDGTSAASAASEGVLPMILLVVQPQWVPKKRVVVEDVGPSEWRP